MTGKVLFLYIALNVLNSCGWAPKEAESNTERLSLKYFDRVIHPACLAKWLSLEDSNTTRHVIMSIPYLGDFLAASEEKRTQHLKECMENSNKFTVDSDGSVLYELPLEEDSITNNQEWIYYHPLLELEPNVYLVYIKFNTGGSSNFTNLFILKNHNRKLELIGVADKYVGDRCNGGVGYELGENEVIITKNFTPLSLIESMHDLMNSKPNLIDTLDSSARSCFAVKKTKLSVQDGKLKVEELGYKMEGETNISFESSYQRCFSKEFENFSRSLGDQQYDLWSQGTIDKFSALYKKNCYK